MSKFITIKKPLNRQADKFKKLIISIGFKSPSILMIVCKVELSERFHSIKKEPQTSTCGHQFRMGKI